MKSAEGLLPSAGDALVVVDVQNDFLPGGALAVPHGERVLEPLNRCMELFRRLRRPVFLTRDWHPADHGSFRAYGGTWPPHCVAGTRGAEFAAALHQPAEAGIVSKGTAASDEGYSAFAGTDLADKLRLAGVSRIAVGGLATDYCVLRSVLDAIERGFGVVVLLDAVAAVDLQPRDGERALQRMRGAGAQLGDSNVLLPASSEG